MLALWAGCVAGAITEDDYCAKLVNAGFGDISLTALQTYGIDDVPERMRCCIPPDLGLQSSKVVSAFIKARKG